MKLKKFVAVAATTGMVGFTALGLGAGVADARPHGPNIPWMPGPGHGNWGPNWGGGGPNGAVGLIG